MLLKNMLNYVDLTFLNPLINFLNDWYISIIIVLIAAGIIYAIVLGINLAKSDNSEKREILKKRIINASLSIVIIIALTLALQFVLKNLNTWVNGTDADNVLTTNEYVEKITWLEGDTGGIGTECTWNSSEYCFEANVTEVTQNSTEEKVYIVFKFNTTGAQYTIDNDNNYMLEITKNADAEGNQNGSFNVVVEDNSGSFIGFYTIKWTANWNNAQPGA